ncbi:MAG: hypothetical protein ACSLE4_04235 [Methyloceanibacter sp.]|uniref:hypothetical protein n=1 Tax=Methyloceanibacter sp. TaxID=1965321 RepID=UPI003EE0DE0F
MAVTSQGKGSAGQKTRAGTMKRKNTIKRRSAPAAALADPRYHIRVVKSAKAYSRNKAQAIEDEDA